MSESQMSHDILRELELTRKARDAYYLEAENNMGTLCRLDRELKAERELSKELLEALDLIPTMLMQAEGPPYNVRFSQAAFEQICHAVDKGNLRAQGQREGKDAL